MPYQIIITLYFAIISVMAFVPITAQAQPFDGYNAMMMGSEVYSSDVYSSESCDTPTVEGFAAFYDVAYRMSEPEALLLMDKLESAEARAAYIDEEAVALAQRLYKSADYYEKTVSNCLISENFSQNNIAAMEKCLCRDERALLELRKAYDESISAYPEWAGAILKVPNERRGYNFVAIEQYDPVKMGETCAVYIVD